MNKMSSLFDKVELLQNTLIARATADEYEVGDYVALRTELLKVPAISPFIPEFVNKNRTLDQFWLFIKLKFPTYAERRKFIWDSFSGLLDRLDTKDTVTCDIDISLTIDDSEEDYIKHEWDKALQRRDVDPEGAITSSRALLETVCKHILDNLGVVYSEGIDIQKLYKLVADSLQLSPDQYNEQIFKQILGGCQSVVNGLGSLRNKFSDAHGKSKKQMKPLKRHASLAVNLSGAMASFLIETYKSRTK